MYHTIIIGAGPAGLFAAYELSKRKTNILVIDRGSSISQRMCPMLKKHNVRCYKCEICNTMNGVGGAGLFSDGKLNLSPTHGKTNLMEFVSKKSANNIINEIDETLIGFGAPKVEYGIDFNLQKNLQKLAKTKNIDLMLLRQKHIGSDNLPGIIERMVNDLEKKGVKFLLNTKVEDLIIKNGKYTGILLDNGKKLESKFLISAPGRVGANWMQEQAKKRQIRLVHRGIEVGVRIEVLAKTYEHITNIMWDPPFFIKDNFTHDMSRTFCTNPNGFVVDERYTGFNCVNGYARKDKKSKNTNFALLCDIKLTHPAEDTIAYGKQIGNISNIIGGGKPFIQRLFDLKKNQRSYWSRINKSSIKPTLTDVTPGDISLALPGRIVGNLLRSIERLDKISPGLNEDALLYGPELKFFSVKLLTNKHLETNINNLFVAGDGVGVAGNIVGAAATGIIAAKGIISKRF